jgi:hypothetical protein
MIKFTMMTNKGPYVFLGICDENVRRLRAGMPIEVDMKELTPPGMRVSKLFVHLGHTYENVVRDMMEADLPVTEEHLQTAQEMDLRLKWEAEQRRSGKSR